MYKNKHTQIITILALSILFSQCSKQLDAITPKDQIPQSELNASDINSLRAGVYSLMETEAWTYWFDFDFRAGNFKSGPGFTIASDYINISPSDAGITAMWQTSYQTLNKINFLIETINGSTSPSSFSSIKGEALYFRALLYYHLVTRWGGVPVLTERTYSNVPRSNETDVWNQVKTDLRAADSLAPAFSDRFYVSSLAVEALLARIYLATNDDVNAILYADKVISSAKFVLAPDSAGYAAMFIAGSSSKELTFALANNTSSNPHLFYQQVNDIDGSWSYSPVSTLYAGLYSDKSIAAGDKRKSAVFSTDNTRIIKFPNGVAGQQLAATTNANYTPIAVSRISEMYLVKAEAQGPGAAAEATLTPYFAARYKIPPPGGTIAAMTATDFQNMLLDERQREFYAEGYRWYDVKRTSRTELLTTLNGRTYLLYYPIPQTEIALAGYLQNDGYN